MNTRQIKLNDILVTKLNELEAAKDNDAKNALIADINKLYNLAIDDDKNEIARAKHELEEDKLMSEIKLAKAKLDLECTQDEAAQKRLDDDQKERRLDRWLSLATALVSVGAPLIFYGVWMKKGLRFEETGTYTSTTFKNLFGKFKPTK